MKLKSFVLQSESRRLFFPLRFHSKYSCSCFSKNVARVLIVYSAYKIYTIAEEIIRKTSRHNRWRKEKVKKKFKLLCKVFFFEKIKQLFRVAFDDGQ